MIHPCFDDKVIDVCVAASCLSVQKYATYKTILNAPAHGHL